MTPRSNVASHESFSGACFWLYLDLFAILTNLTFFLPRQKSKLIKSSRYRTPSRLPSLIERFPTKK
jgi:hypothetical protein